MPYGAALHSAIRHCTWCRVAEVDAELEEDHNTITGAVTIWCVDRAGCRARGDAHRVTRKGRVLYDDKEAPPQPKSRRPPPYVPPEKSKGCARCRKPGHNRKTCKAVIK